MNPKAEAAKQALREAIAKAGGFRTLRLGETIHIHVRDNAAQVYADLVKKAIRTGEAIQHPDGTREFYEWVPLYDVDKSGSDCYTWHRDGNRCQHELIKTLVKPDKSKERLVLKTAFRALENI